jgi:DNA-binding transcriptional LysR family regulator
MPQPHQVLTPDALAMIDTIARTGSFAAAARELGKVPSALTYAVRQLEEALDVLLFDRRSRQAKFTAAGQELLDEGRRLLAETAAVAQRVKRVAAGWETQLTVAVDDIVSRATMLELCEAFYALDPQGLAGAGTHAGGGPGTRLRLMREVLAGTWEALISGRADLAIGVPPHDPPPGVAVEPLGDLRLAFVVSPHHPLAGAREPLDETELMRWRAVAVADSAQRLSPITVNLLPGQDVLTVTTMREKLDALQRGLGCGYLPEPLVRPHLEAGRLVRRVTARGTPVASLHYAWRAGHGRIGLGRALQWWLGQLESPKTRQALLERHAGPLP